MVLYCSASTLCTQPCDTTTITRGDRREQGTYLFDPVQVHGEEDVLPVVLYDV